MSFCRMNDDCDILCYENGNGEIDIILRGNVENPEYSIPSGLTELQEMEYSIKHFDKLYLPWDNPHRAEKHWNLAPFEAAEVLRNLLADGVRFPDSVFGDVAKLAISWFDGPARQTRNDVQWPDHPYEPSLSDVAEAQP